MAGSSGPTATRRAGALERWHLFAVAACSLLAGSVTVWQSLPRYVDPRPQLGAGAYPTWIGSALVVLGLVVLRDALAGTVRHETQEAPQGRRRDIGIAVISLVAYLVVMPRFGFGETTVLFLASQFYLIGRYSPPRAIAYAIALALPLSYLFTEALPMGLPRGVLGR